MSFEIAKAGWLHRLSSVLRNWKRSWFVLYTDGVLKFFKSPDSHVAEEAYVVSTKLLLIKTGSQVCGVTPPPGLDVSSLMMLVFVRDQTLTLCAESLDDMKAWEISLEQARVTQRADQPPAYPAVPPPYSLPYSSQSQSVTVVPGYPGTTYYGTHPPPYVVQQPAGTTTIVYADQPGYYYRRGYDGTDVAMGVVAGAAIGSMMWGPLLWW